MGNKNIIGVNNNVERHNEDFYATDPIAVKLLLENNKFNGDIWEPACGMGHLSEEIKKHGFKVISSDKYYRGYGEKVLDFLKIPTPKIPYNINIITNPPYKYADDFIKKSLSLISDGNQIAMLLQIRYLEGKTRRKEIYDINPPKKVLVSSSRILCSKNATFTEVGSTVCYAWFIWEKGFTGKTTLEWFN